tara:strand:+ start:208538 stop:209026 length:489 start_codon:yes stop_codon:yes gene_type:complete
MGMSVNPRIILGIKMDYLIKTRNVVDEFEVHNKRGEKTGEVGKDVKTFYDIDFKGETLSTNGENEGIYTDEIANMINVEDEPYGKDGENKLGIFNMDYDDETPESLILGVKLTEVDAMYEGGLGIVNMDKLTRDSDALSKILKRDFNCNITPILYLDPNVSV